MLAPHIFKAPNFSWPGLPHLHNLLDAAAEFAAIQLIVMHPPQVMAVIWYLQARNEMIVLKHAMLPSTPTESWKGSKGWR